MVLRKRGFSLIEIVMVLVIVGLLMLIIIPSFSTSTTQAKIAKTKAGLGKLRAAISIYRSEHGSYPGSPASQLSPYLEEIPADGFKDVNTIVYGMDMCGEMVMGTPGGWCYSGEMDSGKIFPNLPNNDPAYGNEDFSQY